jgi:predicted HicB family RNase H-like nuclease
MMNDKYDGFTVELFLDETNDWVAHFLELPSVSAFGETPEEALHELTEAWVAMKESYRKHNEEIPVAPARKEYSGQFNVRIDKRVHRALVMEAIHAGVSLNALIAQKLAKDIHI